MLVYYKNWQIPPITQQRDLILAGFESQFWNNNKLYWLVTWQNLNKILLHLLSSNYQRLL